MPVLVKVYGALHPAGPELERQLSALPLLLPGEEAPFHRAGDSLLFHYEGVFFPLADAIALLTPHALHGRLDYLDLEEWTLTRFTFAGGQPERSTRSLNQVLEYSGH